jgi:hypothetical protein
MACKRNAVHLESHFKENFFTLWNMQVLLQQYHLVHKDQLNQHQRVSSLLISTFALPKTLSSPE